MADFGPAGGVASNNPTFSGMFTHTGASFGINGNTPVAKAGAITSPALTAASPALTAAAVATTASTNVTPNGYSTAAQADAIPVAINALRTDTASLKTATDALRTDTATLKTAIDAIRAALSAIGITS